ncbi:MAG: ABC transporter ATP-binding protein [Bacteroidota bacterium]|jgi:lipoprotein-releasing system ATP-binding protein|nr:lipoprotein-releasing system ATP-binding protein LolD [Bacteroidota bacterium]
MLTAKHIHKSFGSLPVLRGVDMEIAQGEIVSIVGSSGAGKTTLLHILGTLERAEKGELYFEGEALHRFNSKQLSNFRNQKIGFVFQFHHLLPEFTAVENVSIPGWIAGKSNKQVLQDATELLDRLGLSNKLYSKPHELSGGEQQRVAVARSLINKPGIVFADEPTGNLDSANAKSLHQLFQQLRDEMQQTFVIVTHNEELAALSNRILHLKDGRWNT